MKHRCYPFKRHLYPWEYPLPLGLVAGPLLLVYTFGYSRAATWVQSLLLLAAILLLAIGWYGLKTLLLIHLPLKWDSKGVRWMLRKRSWDELKNLTILNLSTIQATTNIQLQFDRYIIFSNNQGEERLRLPFQRRDIITQKLMPNTDPAWPIFLHEVERRFNYTFGALHNTASAFEKEERQAALSVPWKTDYWAITLTLVTGFFAILALTTFSFLPPWAIKIIMIIFVVIMLICLLGHDYIDWEKIFFSPENHKKNDQEKR